MTATFLLLFVVVFWALHGFSGWRVSWKSPEAALALATVATLGASALIPESPLRWYLTMGAVALGFASVVMTLRLVYLDARRPHA